MNTVTIHWPYYGLIVYVSVKHWKMSASLLGILESGNLKYMIFIVMLDDVSIQSVICTSNLSCNKPHEYKIPQMTFAGWFSLLIYILNVWIYMYLYPQKKSSLFVKKKIDTFYRSDEYHSLIWKEVHTWRWRHILSPPPLSNSHSNQMSYIYQCVCVCVSVYVWRV